MPALGCTTSLTREHHQLTSLNSFPDDSSDIEGVLGIIRSVVPPAQVVENNGGEVVISLPQRDPDKSLLYPFSRLLSLLDERMLEFGFGNYGLSSTTLEEVFLSLCTLCDAGGNPANSAQPLHQPAPLGIVDMKEKPYAAGIELDNPTLGLPLGAKHSLTGSALKASQFKALILKRFYHTVKNWKAIFFSIVLPCTFIALAMGFTMIAPRAMPEPSLKLTTQLYGLGPVGFISETPPTMVSEKLLSFPGVGPSCLQSNAAQSHCTSTTGKPGRFKEVPKGALHYTCDTSDIYELGDVPSITAETSDIVYNVTGLQIPNYLLASFPEFIERRLGHVSEVGIAMVVLMGLAFIPSRVIVYVVNERMRDEKQVQSISGIGTLLYWTTTFIWDMGLVLTAVALSAIIIISFGLPVYVSKLNFPAVLLLMVLFGWGTTPVMYCLSRLFKEASISFVVLYCVNLFIGLNIAIIMLVLNIIQVNPVSTTRHHQCTSLLRSDGSTLRYGILCSFTDVKGHEDNSIRCK
ncbi:hypothetical protein HPB48_006755 [Haemaphysalis longicornis]|uniref:ABC-2 type transporter transmembrane domain-containing protein n=1 Tax=Haemaphysalis longicornis TaxID=44386 RepID=A0A9J6G5W0_HAELO|nr:hypothetical protein HPB48_006755 [Haemaphysalis longicornis]